jgi:hypothetical protein
MASTGFAMSRMNQFLQNSTICHAVAARALSVECRELLLQRFQRSALGADSREVFVNETIHLITGDRLVL